MRSSSRSSAELSVVVPALNEGPRLAATVARLQATLPRHSEIVVVDDGSTDGSVAALTRVDRGPVRLRTLQGARQGAAAARNRGARAAHGRAIVFADAHVAVEPGWYAPLLEALEDRAVGAVAPAISAMGQPASRGYGWRLRFPDLSVEWLGALGTSAYVVPLVPGGFLAMRREVFELTGGFDAGMVQYGAEDTELGLRLWLLGYELRVVPQVDVAHQFDRERTYAVDPGAFLHNYLRLAFVHLGRERIRAVVDHYRARPEFGAAAALLADSDVWERRRALAQTRVRDDDWFFGCFD